MDRLAFALTVPDTVYTCSEVVARGLLVSLFRGIAYEVARIAHGV